MEIDIKFCQPLFDDRNNQYIDWNGIYIYDYDKIIINLRSDNFKEVKEYDHILWLFNRIVTHETLHSAIYDITNCPENCNEDNIVEAMLDYTCQ